jgi:deoxyribose-phosphate aldolase
MKSINGFDRRFADEEIKQAIENVQHKYADNRNDETLELAFSCIDLTTLNSTDTGGRGKEFADNVSNFKEQFPGLANVGAICVYPKLVPVVRKNLRAEGVNIAAVSAGFPSSMTFTDVKVMETRKTVEVGADEIDIVISIGDFLAGNYEFVLDEIKQLKEACGTAHLKVILETGALKTPEAIWKASLIAMHAGADFIKTSTGKMDPAATLEAAWVMTTAIKHYHEETGRSVGFKPAGGISTADEALQYLTVVKEVLGEGWMNNKRFRIGASRLANNLLTEILGETVKYF